MHQVDQVEKDMPRDHLVTQLFGGAWLSQPKCDFQEAIESVKHNDHMAIILRPKLIIR